MVFTLRAGMDFLFQPFNPADADQIHVMVVGTSNGYLHLSIYDSLAIGLFRYAPTPQAPSYQLLLHSSHPDVSTHSILLRPDGEDSGSLLLLPMDLPFIASSPINLSLLSSKLTTLQKLLRYIKQTQLHMQLEWRNTRELPERFLRGIQEDLEKAERGPRNIVQALYHTILTGHAYDVVREWLVEMVSERACHPQMFLAGTPGANGVDRDTNAGTRP